jgi:hypothetical protein
MRDADADLGRREERIHLRDGADKGVPLTA